jgi:hypothetical protein
MRGEITKLIEKLFYVILLFEKVILVSAFTLLLHKILIPTGKPHLLQEILLKVL